MSAWPKNAPVARPRRRKGACGCPYCQSERLRVFVIAPDIDGYTGGLTGAIEATCSVTGERVFYLPDEMRSLNAAARAVLAVVEEAP